MLNNYANKNNKRNDIQILRGISILAVLIYHINPSWLPLGYLGVDLFFVISGYVITQQINQAYIENKFSLAEFYNRRIWRLLPSALTVYALAISLGIFASTANDYKESVKVLWGALLFSGNFALWISTNYFSEGGKQLFLHTWSLGIEEQFYLFLPLTFIALGKYSSSLRATIALLIVTSFFLYWFGYSTKSVATFYLLPTRAWELGMGVLIAFLPIQYAEKNFGKYIWPTSVLATALAMTTIISKTNPINQVITVICTSLILAYPINSNASLVLILERLGLKWLGDRSYALYLIHWPLIVIANASFGRTLQLEEQAALLAVILFLTILLHEVVEKPFRHPRHTFSKSAVGYILLAASLAFISGTLSSRRSELETTEPAQVVRTPPLGECASWKSTQPPAHCIHDGEGLRVLVWGDSYAHHLVTGLSSQKNIHITQATRGSCPALWNASLKYNDNLQKGKQWTENCLYQNTQISKSISEKKYDAVIISSSFVWLNDKNINPIDSQDTPLEIEEAFSNLKHEIQKNEARLIIVSPPPVYDYDVGACTERRIHWLWRWGSDNDCSQPFESFSSHLKIINRLQQLSTEVEFINLYDTFCNKGICITEDNSFPVYLDTGHLRNSGSVLAAGAIIPQLEKIFRQLRLQ